MKRVLTIAGSDSGGGAGIQADLKAITILGAFGTSVITALTAQNTVGVQGVHAVPVPFIEMQLESVLSDIGTDAAKTGMLATTEIVEAVASALTRYQVPNLVVDPVMVATSGDPLLDPDAIEAVKTRLVPLADFVTPNLHEAAILSGIPVADLPSMEAAARAIHALGAKRVLVKGGHLQGRAVDLYFDGERFESFAAPRLDTRNTHGTGCTLSAALAAFLAEGFSPRAAVAQAKQFISIAIEHGVDVGKGSGPTNPYAWLSRARES